MSALLIFATHPHPNALLNPMKSQMRTDQKPTGAPAVSLSEEKFMTESTTILTLYTTAADAVDAFVKNWHTLNVPLAAVPGFRGVKLYRATLPETPYQLIALAKWDSHEQAQASQDTMGQSTAYRVVSVTADKGTAGAGPADPLTLINLFSIPARAADGFVAGWPNSTARLGDASGFRGTRLHRAVSPESLYQIVNVARWDSLEQWQAALSGFRPEGERQRPAEANGIAVQPAFYTVVSAIPAPAALPAQD